ncbi:MAG: hypothetical protein IJO32_07515 [Bacilli bacterium]|nr:hypothetical protein [Bacilli bacterium]
MRKNINLFIILLSFILFPNLVNAECSEQQIHELNKLVDNIQFKYEHTGNNLFKVTLYNIPEYITGSSTMGGFNIPEISSNSIDGFIGGYNYKIGFYANEKNSCGVVVLKEKNIIIPTFNKYSEKEMCKDKKYSEFEYCNEFVDEEITDELFEQKLKEYENDNINKNSKKDNKFMLFLKNNYIYILSGLLLVSLIIMLIIYLKKKNKKF